MPETMTEPGLAIERRLELRASPARVWRALTDPAELAAWFSQRCGIDLRPGGEAWFDWDDGGRYAARVEAVEPERRLVIRWATEEDQALDAGPTTVIEWTLEPGRNGGSVLRLRETGFTDPAARFGNVHGWLDELHELAELVAEPGDAWQAGIRETYELRSEPDRVWAAIATTEGLNGWFGPIVGLAIEPGSEGWFDWPAHGRFAVRIEAVEAPRYLAWSWTPHRDVPLADATEVLRTEWYVAGKDGGGTRLHLFETGFQGPDEHRANAEGWATDVLAALRKLLGEA
ncbi:MAG TPA: SRPBCC domain-containing protein [Candidatus Limnocylindrales bacterium]|nr:SRPBCC domain-containing protein [Candidatus Limnocylindrales bacterium]